MNESSPAPLPVLILGLGNDILTDDGIGIRIVDELEKNFSRQFDFKKCSLGGLDTLEIIRDYRQVIMIDAIKTPGGAPGTVYFLKAEDFKKTTHIANFHDIGIVEAIEVGRKLGMRLPEKLDIIAVEIIEDMQFGDRLSPPLETSFPLICEEIGSWISQNLLRK